MRSKAPQLTSLGQEILAKALPAIESEDAKFFSSLDLQTSGVLQALKRLAQIIKG